MIRRPPSTTRTYTPVPYTTLFRSTFKSYGLQAAHIAQIGRRGLKHAKTAVNLSHTAQDQTIIVRFSGDGAIAQACLFHCFVDEQPQMIALAETDKRIFDDIAGLNMRPPRQIMILGHEQSQCDRTSVESGKSMHNSV